MRLRLFALSSVLATIVTVAPQVHAALPDDCTGLGAALVDHSCFHSTYGPFATRHATPGVSALPDTSNLDAVHTEYRVGLAGSESTVTYAPNRSGAFSVFLGTDVPLGVVNARGEPLEALLRLDGATGCAALPVAHVFELVATERYQLVFGPTSSRDVVVVIEYVDDFLIENGRDADGDGYGDPSDTLRSVCLPPNGYVQDASDCNDRDASINPAATERCGDAVDQNCNGLPDDAGLSCSVGEGACRATGVLGCVGESAVCSASEGSSRAESCNGADDDCNGRIDDGAELCPETDRPTCVRDEFRAFCGCLLDLDCGPEDSGRICAAEERRCVSGCSGEAGRNGCPRVLTANRVSPTAASTILEPGAHRVRWMPVVRPQAGAGAVGRRAAANLLTLLPAT